MGIIADEVKKFSGFGGKRNDITISKNNTYICIKT
jgi:hypothetical protein